MHAPASLHILADAAAAANTLHTYIVPVVHTMGVIASLVAACFLMIGGFLYMSSRGQPERLAQAKVILRNALIGLIIVLGASVLTAILSHAYVQPAATSASSLPPLNAIQPDKVSGGLVEVLIKAITGLFNNIVQSVAAPFLKALSFFTAGTPLVAANPGVMHIWLVVIGMADVLFVLAVALLGFHVMSFAALGLEDVELKQLLPRLGFVFLLMNSSVFLIDGIISLSNAMIRAVAGSFATSSVWDVLTAIVHKAGGFGLAALLIMVVFLLFAAILLVYYVGRIVTIYIGAILAPFVLLLWLLPGFRDFAEQAIKVYLATIFVLFVHVLLLELAASLFRGMGRTPDPLMAMVVGIAALVALLKTQGVMVQLSYASIGPRTARKLGGQVISGVSHLTRSRRPTTVEQHTTLVMQPRRTTRLARITGRT